MARFLSALGMAQVCWWLVSNHLQVRGRLAVLQSCLLSCFQVWPLVNNDKLVEYNFLITLFYKPDAISSQTKSSLGGDGGVQK